MHTMIFTDSPTKKIKIRIFLTILFLCINVCAQGYSESFIKYKKFVENSIQLGWDGDRWYPHISVEGGAMTIAYGHKIQPGEDYSNGLTETEATALLISDLKIAETKAKLLIEKNHGVKWSELPQWKKEVFIDFQFNGVLVSFPKFRRAVLDDDLAGMLANYKRYAKTKNGKRIELKARNSGFHKRYLGPIIVISESKR